MIFPGVQELDDKYVTVTKVESRQEYERQTQDYQTTNFGGRTENGKNYFPNEDKDFMEVIIMMNFQFLQTFIIPDVTGAAGKWARGRQEVPERQFGGDSAQGGDAGHSWRRSPVGRHQAAGAASTSPGRPCSGSWRIHSALAGQCSSDERLHSNPAVRELCSPSSQ